MGTTTKKQNRIKHLVECRDEELNNLVKLGRNTIEEKNKIKNYYHKVMLRENLI